MACLSVEISRQETTKKNNAKIGISARMLDSFCNGQYLFDGLSQDNQSHKFLPYVPIICLPGSFNFRIRLNCNLSIINRKKSRDFLPHGKI